MPSVFLVSDTHFGHHGVCHFTRNDGVTKLRPWDNAEEMDEEMVKRWNETVRPNDKVLIRGNHDIFRDDEYRQYFRELRAYHVMNGMILSHIPIHTESLGRFGTNIHGHLHANRVMKMWIRGPEIDTRYHCVCVEQTDFRPILFEDVIKRIEEEGGEVGFRNGNGPTID